MIDSAPNHHNSQLPSPALSNPASSENKHHARPGQHHEIPFEGLPSKAACCGEQTRALTVSASNTLTATPSIASSRDTSTDCEDNISVLRGLNWQPQHKGKQLRSNSPPHHVLHSQVNTESNQCDQPPSVAVKRCWQNLISKTAQNTSVSTSCHSKGSIATLEAPSGVDFLTSPGEAQEIFGHSIICIQPHGQQHAYFLTFLPDAIDHLPSHIQPQSAPDQPLFTKHATHTSSKACAVKKGNVQLAHCQTQNQRVSPKTQNNHSTRHKNSRKGKPWLPEEEELLMELRRNWGLPCSTVTRLFLDQYQGRSQGSIQDARGDKRLIDCGQASIHALTSSKFSVARQ
ncbi:hypothetical protein CIRG_10013 [Coccidioides immitis RMSCC 2394]|uniref:Myb-like domain-containing protein n=1 Tax=Coccidioides immitis RMSCC 2394 TaxID=404692 RepID=A0A0J6Y376_COCIT|nr:hypothetical protein CIRG_10013 [Coccidioides immitis RMSCC 2394]